MDIRSSKMWIEESYKKLSSHERFSAQHGLGDHKKLGFVNAVIDAYENPTVTNIKLAEALRACSMPVDAATRTKAMDAYKAAMEKYSK